MSVAIDYSSGAFEANMAQGVGTVTAATGGAYSLANFSYDSVSFSVATQEPGPSGLFFKPDGYKMYICGVTGVVALGFKEIHEYDLSTAWDFSTASYSQSLSVSSAETTPQGIFFKDDGTKMFIIGNTGDAVHEYTLSTAWDISTASFVDSTSISSQSTNPQDLFFKSDGTKLYVLAGFGSAIHQYTLSTAWDASSLSYDSVSFDLDNTINASSAKGIFFKPDGTELWAVFDGGNRLAQFNLSTAWDVSTASYDSVIGLVNFSEEGTPQALFFKSDGSKLYIVGQTNDTVYQYSTLPDTTIDISSGTYFNYTPSSTTKFAFSNPPASGAAAGFALALTGANVAEGYDIANASYDGVSLSLSPYTSIRGLFFKDDGTKLYVVSAGATAVYEYNLSTAWDVSSGTYSQAFDVGNQEGNPNTIFFKDDGTKMYILGRNGDDVNEYNLSTAWDISTASYSQVFSVASQETNPFGMFFKPDGLKLYIIGLINNTVYEYTLTTAWDVSSASYSSNSFSVNSQDTNPREINFNDNGTKMYMIGIANDNVYEYDLSTAWDVSTASYNSVSFSIGSQELNATAFRFKSGGFKMYVVGALNTVYQYSTSGAGSAATFTYPSSVEFAGGTAPDGPAIGETDVLVFYTNDGGTTYQGFKPGMQCRECS
jgi:sugar lactone lactonase YvrE